MVLLAIMEGAMVEEVAVFIKIGTPVDSLDGLITTRITCLVEVQVRWHAAAKKVEE